MKSIYLSCLLLFSLVITACDSKEDDQAWLQQRNTVASNPNYPTRWWNDIEKNRIRGINLQKPKPLRIIYCRGNANTAVGR